MSSANLTRLFQSGSGDFDDARRSEVAEGRLGVIWGHEAILNPSMLQTIGTIENGRCFEPKLLLARMRPQGLAQPHPLVQTFPAVPLDGQTHRFLRDVVLTVRFFVVVRFVVGLRLTACAFCARTRSAWAWVMSPDLTRAEMQTFDTRLMERDMQARRPSVPTLYALQ
jgi:hypothetical protein